ncbi:LamG domain-containing protein [Candidatus Poribacteria bacterium]|nr:LamG domain-containing protein [Candidatus Poribacteria bacterium]
MKSKFTLTLISVLFITCIFAIPGYTKIDPKTCIGAWLFDDISGNLARDSSGNRNDGTLMNGPKQVDGKFEKALSFDGIDDYISLPPITAENWEGLTLSAWVWLNLLPNELPSSYDEIFGTKQDLYDMYEDKSNNELRVKVTTTVSAERPGIPTAQLKKNQWLHIAGIYDKSAGQMKIYMNGQLMDTHNLTGFVNGLQNSAIGAQGDPGGVFTDFHNGLIDEVALFKVALSDQDLQTLMNRGLKESLGIAAVVNSGKLTSTWADLKVR